MSRFKTERFFRHLTIPLKFFFLLFLTSVPPGIFVAAAVAADIAINCNIHAGACTQNLPGFEITLDISPKPVKAMQDLVFKVALAGQGPHPAPYIDLGMPGMKMGPNRVALKERTGAVFEGKGVIVRCPSGRRTWRATVTVPGKGKVDFVFDVVY